MSDPNEWGWFYARSEDDERFDHAESREDAIELGTDAFDGESFHICEARLETLRDDFFNADQIFEMFEDHNEDAWGEDGPDGKVLVEAARELEEVLNAAFAAWRVKHRPWIAYNLTEFRNAETITPQPVA